MFFHAVSSPQWPLYNSMVKNQSVQDSSFYSTAWTHSKYLRAIENHSDATNFSTTSCKRGGRDSSSFFFPICREGWTRAPVETVSTFDVPRKKKEKKKKKKETKLGRPNFNDFAAPSCRLRVHRSFVRLTATLRANSSQPRPCVALSRCECKLRFDLFEYGATADGGSGDQRTRISVGGGAVGGVQVVDKVDYFRFS